MFYHIFLYEPDQQDNDLQLKDITWIHWWYYTPSSLLHTWLTEAQTSWLCQGHLDNIRTIIQHSSYFKYLEWLSVTCANRKSVNVALVQLFLLPVYQSLSHPQNTHSFHVINDNVSTLKTLDIRPHDKWHYCLMDHIFFWQYKRSIIFMLKYSVKPLVSFRFHPHF